jgi:hypothetical protein
VGAPGWGIEFMDPPQCPFFEYPSGRNSPYGEQTLVLLRCMAATGGLSCSAYAEDFARTFGPGFDGYRDVSTKVGGAGRWMVVALELDGGRCGLAVPQLPDPAGAAARRSASP